MSRQLFIATINARTLAPLDKQEEMENALDKIKWDVIAVQEARIVGLASFNLTSSGTVVYHSGGATATNGVAFLLRSHIAQHAEFHGLSDRLATLKLPQERLFLVCAYAPTSSYDDATYDDFIDQVDAALQRSPRGYMPVLLGDFNCRVAREPGTQSAVGKYASTTPNSRGRTFTEVCVRNRLRIWNTFIKRRQGRRWTWRSPNGQTLHQIDFIAAPISARVVNCGVIGRFEFNSDHRLVRLCLSIPGKVRHTRRRERFELDKAAFTANAHDLASTPLARPTSASEAYNSIQSFATTSATNCWVKQQISPWISNSTRALLAERHKLKCNPTTAVAFSTICKAARTSLIEDIRRRKENQALDAAKLGRSISKAMRNMEHSRKRLLVPDPANGALSQEATKAAVCRFYSELYKPAVELPLAVSNSLDPFPPFLVAEARYALLHLKCGHSPGTDGILPEMLYHARAYIAPFMADLLNYLVAGNEVPDRLAEAVVTLLHKKGEPTNISNFRPISLLTVTLKTITRVIMNRIEGSLEEAESSTQTGFRKGNSTLNNLHIVKQVVEKTREYGIPLYLGFVDFKKAFDCVEWNAVWQALAIAGVNTTLIHLLRRIYESSATKIRVNEDLVPVNIRRGVRQGDTLSPRLFNAVLRFAMNDIDWENDGIKIDGKNLVHLEYADDVALIAKNKPEMERMLKKLIEACARVGLEVNANKTVLLTSCTTTRTPIQINNSKFVFAESAKYLGSKISLTLDENIEIEHRIQLGWFAWSKLSKLLTSRLIPMKTKRKLFDTCITSTVLYGSEVWALRENEKERLNVTQRKMERKLIGITWKERWRNERLRKITGVKDWNDEALQRKTNWARKISEMEHENWTRISTLWIPYNRTRPPGRPRTRWRDDLRKKFGMQWWSALNTVAYNKEDRRLTHI